jgi:hypothetical protein
VESIFRSYTLCTRPDSEPIKLLYHPKQKPRGGGGLRQINTCRQVPLGQFVRKADVKDGVYLVIWSMTIPVCVRQQTSLFPANCSRAHESHGPPRYAAFRFHRPGLRPRPTPPPFYPRFATFIQFSTTYLFLPPSLAPPASSIYKTSIQSSFLQFYSSISLKSELKKESPGLSIPKYIELHPAALNNTVNLGQVSIKQKNP